MEDQEATTVKDNELFVGQYVTGQKGRSPLLMDPHSFKYRKHKSNSRGSLVFYKCQKRFDKDLKCRATAVLNPETMKIVRITNEHNHCSVVVSR